MPRAARIVVPGVPHHVTQRGNRRQQTFFQASDYATYVERLAEHCSAVGVEILAWCLMPNHVHLVAVPPRTDSLRAALAPVHRSYTWTVNRRNGWTGHLWQDRFVSCPMDEAHLIAAIRYVELNPVRARLVSSPEAWPWSSTQGRVVGKGDRLVEAGRPEMLAHVTDWGAFLAEGLSEEEAEGIRVSQRKGTALGSTEFVRALEAQTGRAILRRRRGRPRADGRENGDGSILVTR